VRTGVGISAGFTIGGGKVGAACDGISGAVGIEGVGMLGT